MGTGKERRQMEDPWGNDIGLLLIDVVQFLCHTLFLLACLSYSWYGLDDKKLEPSR